MSNEKQQPPRRTKIVATMGPASSKTPVIRKLIETGVDVFRLNFSHGKQEEHRQRCQTIRDLAQTIGRTVGILQDLQGPKIRVTTFADSAGVELVPGAKFVIDTDTAPGDINRVGTTLPQLCGEVHPGQRLLLDDGRIQLKCTAQKPDAVETEVVVGGRLTDHKGINLPDCDLSVPALSEKDVADLEFGAELKVDWVALSFVRTVSDLQTAREHLARVGSRAKLMAKIEKPGAVARFDDILVAADGIMVARGDLGVEMRPEQVPVIQKRIIHACIEAGKPVITATQMLESMVDAPIPTRAEASDVANAIFDGTDAVMLSAETAAGHYPVEAVQMMDRVAREVESSETYADRQYRAYARDLPTVQDAICHSACKTAEILEAAAIASFTTSGSTAWRVARHRPKAKIVALTPSREVARQLALGWGMIPVVTAKHTDSDNMAEDVLGILREVGLVHRGEKIIITAGLPLEHTGITNLLRVAVVHGNETRLLTPR